MSDIIHLLPDSVANQIAAGEVIQRPASVVKELVENAVDAGATQIDLVVRDAGRTLIQVIDNGKGMTPTDARMAFERHATSKITQSADLFTLSTMGFRGEALPSICAVSQVELRTCAKGASMGTILKISGSRVESQEAAVCAPGASFSVKNLFFNVPARRKFLKSDNVESGNIMREFERLALVNNDIGLSIDTGARKISLRPAPLKQRITDIWKNNLNLQLLPIDVETGIVKITGFISRPENARRRNALQFLIVNGRNMRHPYFHHAILECYERLIAADTQPNYFLKFEVDPATIDVNIHPTKNEIKFENEASIRPILTAAVRESLGKFAAVPSIDFNSDSLPVNPLRHPEGGKMPETVLNRGYNPFKHAPAQSRDWEALYRGFTGDVGGKTSDILPDDGITVIPEVEFKNAPLPGITRADEVMIGEYGADCMQVAKKYIVTTARDGILVIDQYRAHVKVLYERFIRTALTDARVESQRLLFAEKISLDGVQGAVMEAMCPMLERLGFSLVPAGESGEWEIKAVPASIPNAGSASEFIYKLLEQPEADLEAMKEEDRLATTALAAARASAVRRGDTMTVAEMEALMAELFALPDPGLTPYGAKVMTVITDDRLASLLG